MRILTLMSVVMTFFAFTACSQDVPKKVSNAFAKKFPNAKNVKWDKENDTEWEAEFKLKGKEYSANFTTDGSWKETEHEIGKSEIPEAVKNTLNKKFTGYEIEESEISESADGTVYEFELEKGETEVEIAISPDGKVVKKEMRKVKGEEDEDEGDEE